MRSLLHLFALSEILSLALANNHPLHRHLLSRQSVDCLPILLQHPSILDVHCGGESTYLSPSCTCCPRGASGFIGCTTATDVCSTDSYGNAICCPKDQPDCAGGNGSAATTASPSSTTANDYPGSAITSTQPDSGPTSAPSQNNTGSATTTSAVATVSNSGASTFMLVELKSLVMIMLLGLI